MVTLDTTINHTLFHNVHKTEHSYLQAYMQFYCSRDLSRKGVSFMVRVLKDNLNLKHSMVDLITILLVQQVDSFTSEISNNKK